MVPLTICQYMFQIMVWQLKRRSAIIWTNDGLVYSRALQWHHNGRDSVSNHQPHDCLLNRLFRRRSKKTSKLCVTGLCVGNSLGTGEFPAQMASNAENVSIWWRQHEICPPPPTPPPHTPPPLFFITGPFRGESTHEEFRCVHLFQYQNILE